MSAPLALVTGGVRRVGAVISGRLAQAGYAVALHGHSNAEPEDDLKKVLEEQDSEWRGFVADFAETESASNLLEEVEKAFGRCPDLLVNSASIFGQDDVTNINAGSLEKHMMVNLISPVLLTTELARKRGAGDRGCVVQILDQRIRNPNQDQLSYTLSKQALSESVRTLALNCCQTLRINGVAPGLTLTAGESSKG